MLLSLLLLTALANDPAANPDEVECDGSEEFCARLRKALELGEKLAPVVEAEAFEGVEQVNYRDLEIRKPIRPKAPAEAKVQSVETRRCTFRMFIDEKGFIYDLRFVNCPTMFHDAVRAAAADAKFAPVRIDGQKVKVTCAHSVTFD